jgi:hypothetical protein
MSDGFKFSSPGRSIVVALTFATLVTFGARGAERDLQVCAAYDLHLVWHIEEWAELRPTETDRALAGIDAMLAARRACRAGAFPEAIRIYEGFDLDPTPVRWLR